MRKIASLAASMDESEPKKHLANRMGDDKILPTDENNSVVVTSNSDIGPRFHAEARNVGTLGTNDPWECRAVR